MEQIKNSNRNVFGNSLGKKMENNAAHAMILPTVSARCANVVVCQFNVLYLERTYEFRMESMIVVVEQPSI